jgi:hypothetical protein
MLALGFRSTRSTSRFHFGFWILDFRLDRHLQNPKSKIGNHSIRRPARETFLRRSARLRSSASLPPKRRSPRARSRLLLPTT